VITIYLSQIHPSVILLYLPFPLLRIVSTDLIFPFSYMSTQYFHQNHLLHPFPISSPFPTGTNPQSGPIVSSCPSFFKIATQSFFRGLSFHVSLVGIQTTALAFVPVLPVRNLYEAGRHMDLFSSLSVGSGQESNGGPTM
jgi:hypothetical protein